MGTSLKTGEDTWLPQPDLADVSIETLLRALADPVRLQIVRLLDRQGEAPCGGLVLPVKASTVSHHLRTLRECGLVESRLAGNSRISSVRRGDLEQRFPGLLDSILQAGPARKADTAEEAGGEG